MQRHGGVSKISLEDISATDKKGGRSDLILLSYGPAVPAAQSRRLVPGADSGYLGCLQARPVSGMYTDLNSACTFTLLLRDK